MAMARTMDRRRLRATALVSSRARVRAWECVFVKRGGPFWQADQILRDITTATIM